MSTRRGAYAYVAFAGSSVVLLLADDDGDARREVVRRLRRESEVETTFARRDTADDLVRVRRAGPGDRILADEVGGSDTQRQAWLVALGPT